MRKKTTYVFNIILMIVVLIFTFYTLLHGEDLRSILKVLRGADKSWLIFAALFAMAYLVLQAVSLKIIVQSAGTPMRLKDGIRYTFIGFLFNAITPSARAASSPRRYAASPMP